MSAKSLKESAAEAYKNSPLKAQDVEQTKEAAEQIKKFLAQFGIEADVTSDVFEMEEIQFWTWRADITTEGNPYTVYAGWRCKDCGESINEIVAQPSGMINPASFGQWLSKPHLCAFSKPERDKVGFR